VDRNFRAAVEYNAKYLELIRGRTKRLSKFIGN